MDCLFCKIARKEFGSAVVYEDGDVLAFLDIQPRAPGHTMVVSKVHSETLLDLPDEALAPLIRGVRAATAILKKALAPDGFTIGINHGKASGQVIDHLHVHIIPRWNGDGGGSIHSVVAPARPNPPAGGEGGNPPQETLEDTAAKIRAAR